MGLAILTVNGQAQDEKQGPLFAITEENDFFSNPFDHTDRHYTQGLKLTYRGGDDEIPALAARVSQALPRLGIQISAQNLGYVYGQNIYTPKNLRSHASITTDRPYAGWLYGGVYLQRRGRSGMDGIPVMENFEIDAGLTGSPSLAGTIQVTFHHAFFPRSIPDGWHNQIAAEPGLLLKYERFWRLSPTTQTACYFDLIPHVGAKVGNIEISGNIGGTLRAGVNLPDDFGAPLIDSPASPSGGITSAPQPFSFYIFGGGEERVVGQNLFLDGSTFRGGPSVERIPWVADLSYGAAMRPFRHVELSYTHVVRTLEFVGQRHDDIFGSFEVKAMFQF